MQLYYLHLNAREELKYIYYTIMSCHIRDKYPHRHPPPSFLRPSLSFWCAAWMMRDMCLQTKLTNSAVALFAKIEGHPTSQDGWEQQLDPEIYRLVNLDTSRTVSYTLRWTCLVETTTTWCVTNGQQRATIDENRMAYMTGDAWDDARGEGEPADAK